MFAPRERARETGFDGVFLLFTVCLNMFFIMLSSCAVVPAPPRGGVSG